MKKNNEFTHPELAKQRELVEKIKDRDDSYNVIIADAFLRGMKDLGYKSTARAVDELIDNSIQAGAANIHVRFNSESGLTKSEHPEELVILDDGHGMDPNMIRYCLNWGGTHRPGDRSGFGRYGYGLKSAAVSFGDRIEIYSKPEDGVWCSTYLDIDELCFNFQKDRTKSISIPPAKPTKLNPVHQKMFDELGKDKKSGTIVVISKIDRDRLTKKKHDTLRTFLLEEIGITYRHHLKNVKIQVEGTEVIPVDPLFIMPGGAHTKTSGVSAVARPEHEFVVSRKDRLTGNIIKGKIKIRYSWMPLSFMDSEPGSKSSPRLAIRKKNHGIIFCRAGRQLDVVPPPWISFGNDLRHIGVEVDFNPSLDEEFGVSTSKQGVSVTESMWDKLREEGVEAEISQMFKTWKEDKTSREVKQENGEGKKQSELIMEQASPLLDSNVPIPIEAIQTADENLKKKIEHEAKELRVDPEKIKKIIFEETQNNPFKLKEQALKGAAFYEPESYGSQIVVTLNTNHRFYTSLYGSASKEVRTGLELFLFVLAKAELRSSSQVALFYEAQRTLWSAHLNNALGHLQVSQSLKGQESDLTE